MADVFLGITEAVKLLPLGR